MQIGGSYSQKDMVLTLSYLLCLVIWFLSINYSELTEIKFHLKKKKRLKPKRKIQKDPRLKT